MSDWRDLAQPFDWWRDRYAYSTLALQIRDRLERTPRPTDTNKLPVRCYNFAEAFGTYHLLPPAARRRVHFSWLEFS